MKTIHHHHICPLSIHIIYILSLICISWSSMISAAARSPETATGPSSVLSPVSPAEFEEQDGAQQDPAAQMTDIHDIKPLEPLGANPLLFLYILIAVAVLALFIILFLVWKKRRKQQTEDEVAVLPPEEIARLALNDLADMKLEDGRIFYFRLSAILRGYIEARHDINALEMTSEEFLPEIENLGIDRESQQNLRELVRSTDPVKFAGQAAIGTQMQHDMAFVRDYIKQTTPVRDLAENV